MMSDDEVDVFQERRRCSDEQCDKARTKWVEEVLWPKLRIQIATMIGATVIFCSGVFIYLSQNAIRDYDLAARDRYLTTEQHRIDMGRLESKLQNIEATFSAHLVDVRKSLDRNLSAIQAIGGRR